MRIRTRNLLTIAALSTLAAGTVAMLPSSADVRRGDLREAVATTMLDVRGVAARTGYGRYALPEPQVEPKRSGAAGRWRFGTVVIPVPRGIDGHAGPEAALYVARRTAAGWQVALDGTPEFVTLAKQAPGSVVSGDEKELFAANQRAALLPLPELPPLPPLLPGRPTSPSPTAAPTGSPAPSPSSPRPTMSPGSPSPTAPTPSPTGADPSPTTPSPSSSPTPGPTGSPSTSPTPGPTGSPTSGPGVRTGLMLPFKIGDRWWMGGGPHGAAGHKRPFNSLDFSGGDGRVLAAAPGRMYRFCSENTSRGLIRVIHSNGLTTDYYHMTDTHGGADGTAVRRGDYLGHIGSELPCGGSASGDHVHFGLRKKGEMVPVDGLVIGGWTFHEGAEAYQGYAERDGERVEVRQRITNHGPS
ncbi:MAG: M23 family metallopeptidase [Micromonosporaceae bacterium]